MLTKRLGPEALSVGCGGVALPAGTPSSGSLTRPLTRAAVTSSTMARPASAAGQRRRVRWGRAGSASGVAAAGVCVGATVVGAGSTTAPAGTAGGRGAVREAVELILRAQGRWRRLVERYRGERL